MPPAFVLSQDQTLKFDLQSSAPGENPRRTTEILRFRSCTKVNYYIWICVKDICASRRNWLPEHPAPQSRRIRGRRPHVPSSNITMSKSRPTKNRTLSVPRYSYRRRECPVMLATVAVETLVSVAAVRGHIWMAFDSVNRVFAILFQNFHVPAKTHDFVSNFR